MGREWRAPAGPLGGPRPGDCGLGRKPQTQDVTPQAKTGIVQAQLELGILKLGPLECPKSSINTTAAATTFKGPNSQNGGTAACIYLDQTGNELNVIYDSPGESKSKWVATDPSNIGQPAPAVPGLGEAAFETTTLGHAEVDIYESSSKEVAVTLDPSNGASVTPSELTEVLAIGHSLVRLPYPG